MRELLMSNQLGFCQGWCACVMTYYPMICESLELKKEYLTGVKLEESYWCNLIYIFSRRLMFCIECYCRRRSFAGEVKDTTQEAFSCYLHLWFGYTFNRCFSEAFLIVTRWLCVYWVVMQNPIVRKYICYLSCCYGLYLFMGVVWFATTLIPFQCPVGISTYCSIFLDHFLVWETSLIPYSVYNLRSIS